MARPPHDPYDRRVPRARRILRQAGLAAAILFAVLNTMVAIALFVAAYVYGTGPVPGVVDAVRLAAMATPVAGIVVAALSFLPGRRRLVQWLPFVFAAGLLQPTQSMPMFAVVTTAAAALAAWGARREARESAEEADEDD